MSYNDDILYHLASNPDYASFNGLQARLGRNITEKGLARVLSEDVIEALKNLSPRDPFLDSNVMGLAGQPIKRSKKVNAHTSVFFWGTRYSGKTSVIGTLLACVPEGWIVREKPTANRRERALELNEYFQPGKVILPGSTGDEPARVQYSRVYYRHHKREYAISLIESPLPGAEGMDPKLEELLEQEGEQIHILCFDCTQDMEDQSKKLCSLLDLLERNHDNSIENRTAGIYVLVTKTDAMYRVPLEHRADAAQTLITASNRILWSKIWNLCYRYGIRGTFPVSYSIGQVQLRQMADINLTAARHLWKDILIPFSQPIPTVLESVLWTGNGWVTALLFLLSLAGMGRLVADAVQGSAPAPEELLSAFDYVEDFRLRESRDVAGKPYTKARNAFNNMIKDLDLECSIVTAGGDTLMTEDEAKECRDLLVNDMARITVETAETGLRRDKWDYETIKDMRFMFRRLSNSGCLGHSTKSNVDRWYNTYSLYLDKICKFPKNPTPITLEDVKDHRNTAEIYKRESPFNGSKYVKGELDRSVATADEYYAQLILSMAQSSKGNKDLLNKLINDFENYLPDNQHNYGYEAYSTIQTAKSYVGTGGWSLNGYKIPILHKR